MDTYFVADGRYRDTTNHFQIYRLKTFFYKPIRFKLIASCIPDFLKGIDRSFRRGVKSSLIRSLFINWRLGNVFFLILKGFHHKISKKPKDPA